MKKYMWWVGEGKARVRMKERDRIAAYIIHTGASALGLNSSIVMQSQPVLWSGPEVTLSSHGRPLIVKTTFQQTLCDERRGSLNREMHLF